MSSTLTIAIFGVVMIISNVTTYFLNSRCKHIQLCGQCVKCEREVLDQDHLQSANNTNIPTVQNRQL